MSLVAYGPTSSISERALLRGYGEPDVPVSIDRAVEPQPCACGGLIEPGIESQVAGAVYVHTRTPQHLAWRARMGIR